MNKLIIGLLFLFLFAGYLSLAQVPPLPSPVVAPSMSPMPAPVVQSVSSVVDKIPSSMPAWVLAIVAFLVELAMRFWPTIQPRSVFIMVGQLFGVIGLGFQKISSLLDQVVQNIKDKPKA